MGLATCKVRDELLQWIRCTAQHSPFSLVSYIFLSGHFPDKWSILTLKHPHLLHRLWCIPNVCEWFKLYFMPWQNDESVCFLKLALWCPVSVNVDTLIYNFSWFQLTGQDNIMQNPALVLLRYTTSLVSHYSHSTNVIIMALEFPMYKMQCIFK